MEQVKEICNNCRFIFLHMKEQDVPLLVKHNPELDKKFKPGQKMCVKKDIFVYKDESCGCFCAW